MLDGAKTADSSPAGDLAYSALSPFHENEALKCHRCGQHVRALHKIGVPLSHKPRPTKD